jgi:hypothetical protein
MDQHGGDPMAQRHDTAFKLTLQQVDVAMRELVGLAITSWKNVEFPQIGALGADLLAETKAGELVHIELQSGNSKNMAIRMLEYGLAALRKHHRYPTQVCLCVGEKPARMKKRAVAVRISSTCTGWWMCASWMGSGS